MKKIGAEFHEQHKAEGNGLNPGQLPIEVFEPDLYDKPEKEEDVSNKMLNMVRL